MITREEKLITITLIGILFLQMMITEVKGTNSEFIFEGFENGLPEGWIYAHSALWSISTVQVLQGNYSLQLNGSGGLEFEGIQIPISMSNGSIEAWVYPAGTNIKEPMLYLRTGTNDGNELFTISSGYGFRLYKNYAALFRISNYTLFNLLTVYLDSYISDRWWHMKLEANGSILSAWVTESIIFTEPIIEYDIVEEEEQYQYYSGYPALSGRANK